MPITPTSLALPPLRPTAPVGVVGGAAVGRYGSAYEHNTRLVAHQDAVQAMRSALSYWAAVAGVRVWRHLAHLPTWRLTPGTDSLESLAYHAHVSRCIGLGVDGPVVSPIGAQWAARLDETLTAALYGFGVWETWAVERDGAWYAQSEVRDQASIQAWRVEQSGRLVGCEQQALTGGVAFIPASRLLRATYSPRAADDYSGVGLLRPVEPLYRDAVQLSQAYAAGAQRWAIPTPDYTVDAAVASACGISPVTPEWVDGELEKWSATMRGYLGHHLGQLGRPPWIVLGTYGGGISELDRVQTAIDNVDRRILSVFYGQWLMLGTGNSGGSYSLGEAQISAAREHAASLCAWVIGVWQEFIQRAVEWQFGPVWPQRLPRLEAVGLGTKAWSSHLAHIASLVSVGALTATDDVEDALRDGFELPRMPDSLRGRERGKPGVTAPADYVKPQQGVRE